MRYTQLLNFEQPDFPKPGLAHKFGSALNEANLKVAWELARSKGCTSNQVALSWLLQQPFPTCPVVGPRTRKQIDDSLGERSSS